ncbi:MAG: hypothetical protein QM775_34390 [Pirellulales bacterium]
MLLRQGKYKYVRTFVKGETEELYDLEADPEELKNLAGESVQADWLATLRKSAITELKRTEAKFAEALPKTKAEFEAQAEGGKKAVKKKAATARSPSSASRFPVEVCFVQPSGARAAHARHLLDRRRRRRRHAHRHACRRVGVD